MDGEAVRLFALRDRLLVDLADLGGMTLNGAEHRLPGNANVSFDGVDGEALSMRVRPWVSLSTGSACTSASLEPSHVLTAIGAGRHRAEGAIRIGLGRNTTEEEVAAAANAIGSAVRELRATVSITGSSRSCLNWRGLPGSRQFLASVELRRRRQATGSPRRKGGETVGNDGRAMLRRG